MKAKWCLLLLIVVGCSVKSADPLDWGIEGEGLFQVRTIHNGEEVIAYTRAGNFVRNRNGDIVLGSTDGSLLEPHISLPADLVELEVTRDGLVLFKVFGGNTRLEAGRIELARLYYRNVNSQTANRTPQFMRPSHFHCSEVWNQAGPLVWVAASRR